MNYLRWFLLLHLTISASPVFIIIPGTWSHTSSWHLPRGYFFKALKKANPHAMVITFVWSGKNNHAARAQAAEHLARLIKKLAPVVLIAHSHGANIGILASHMVHHDTISHFFALGTPVSPAYQPNMKAIGTFYNLFSLADIVQPCLGLFGRVYPESERVFNIRTFINGKEPNHSQLHSIPVAQWLMHVPTLAQKNSLLQSMIYFFDAQPPVYLQDKEQNELVELDKEHQHQLSAAHLHDRKGQYEKNRGI